MPNRYTPEKKTVGQLLSMTNPPILVPDWQRNYSWTSTEVEEFWQDLIKFDSKYSDENINDQEYFLGSIVLVDNNTDHLLLDGQQRLATSTILVSVIRDFLGRYKADAATRTQNKFLSDFDDALNRNIYKLRLNKFDRDYFQRTIIEPRSAEYQEIEPRIESHKSIKKAKDFFTTQFEAIFAEVRNEKEAHQRALRILKVLTNHFSVVAVISGDEDNAAAVFETLNDRGIGLSTPDLLRNLILRRTNVENMEEVLDLWDDILEIEKDTKLNVFIRHYWISHYGDVKSRSLYREIKEFLISKNIDSLTFSRSLRDASVIYNEIVNASSENQEANALFGDINTISSNVLYPAILACIEVNGLDGSINFVKALIITYVRYKIVSDLESSRLESLIFTLCQNLRNGLPLDDLIKSMIDFSPSDDRFVNNFKVLSLTSKSNAYYLLKEIETNMRKTEELSVNPPRKVHVEHIYPQNPQAGLKLDHHNRIIDKIGNLTLLSRKLNTTIKNSPFKIKKEYYRNSELLLTQGLVNFESWTENEITNRQTFLSEAANKIWNFSGLIATK